MSDAWYRVDRVTETQLDLGIGWLWTDSAVVPRLSGFGVDIDYPRSRPFDSKNYSWMAVRRAGLFVGWAWTTPSVALQVVQGASGGVNAQQPWLDVPRIVFTRFA